MLLHAFEAQAERNTEESDESNRTISDNLDDSRPRNRSLKYENVMFDHPAASKLDEDSGANTSESRHKENLRLSSLGDGPIDEYEEWKKVSTSKNFNQNDCHERSIDENCLNNIRLSYNKTLCGTYLKRTEIYFYT